MPGCDEGATCIGWDCACCGPGVPQQLPVLCGVAGEKYEGVPAIVLGVGATCPASRASRFG